MRTLPRKFSGPRPWKPTGFMFLLLRLSATDATGPRGHQTFDDHDPWTRAARMPGMQPSQVMFAMLTKAGCITFELTGPLRYVAKGPE